MYIIPQMIIRLPYSRCLLRARSYQHNALKRLIALLLFGAALSAKTAPPSPQKVALSISLTAVDAIAKHGAKGLKAVYRRMKPRKP